jgi:membrane fusion protein, multidrug efflux system
MVDALGALAAKKRALLALPRRKLQLFAVAALLILAAFSLIRWPLRVSGSQATFRPMALAPVRALVPGVLERMLVSEGMAVTRGQPLATLRAIRLTSARAATAGAAAAADRSAALAASRGDPAEERLQRIRAEALRQELSLLDEEVGYTTIRAPVSGIVLTAHPNELIGASLDEGDLVLTVGRLDTLELEFGVEQRDIGRVTPGQEVHLRVDALPQRTFVGRVTSIGQLPADSGATVHYPVRASLANPDQLLKPRMAAYARVLTPAASALDRLVRAPYRWVRLLWWKIRA